MSGHENCTRAARTVNPIRLRVLFLAGGGLDNRDEVCGTPIEFTTRNPRDPKHDQIPKCKLEYYVEKPDH
jgi:hypothetical protein